MSTTLMRLVSGSWIGGAMTDLGPRVLNKRDGHFIGVYVGRPSKWGNPFKVGVDGDIDEVIEKYERYLYESGLIKDVAELRGKNLVCWCAPAKCHGDVLLRLSNG